MMCISNFSSLFWMIFVVFSFTTAILSWLSNPNKSIFDVFPYLKVKLLEILKNDCFWTVWPRTKVASAWKSVKIIQKYIKKLLNGIKSPKIQELRKSYVDFWVKGPKFQTYLPIFTLKWRFFVNLRLLIFQMLKLCDFVWNFRNLLRLPIWQLLVKFFCQKCSR